jgi:hypothetical protein
MHDFLLRFDEQSARWNLRWISFCLIALDRFTEQGRLGRPERIELHCLTARLNEHRSQRETPPKGRIGWLRSTANSYIEAQRERLVGHLMRQVLYRILLRSDRRDYEHAFCGGMLVEI